MNQTENTIELDCALLAAQSEFPAIEKTKDNPFYKSKYAPYEAIYRGVKPFLCKNGLVIMHDPKVEFTDMEAAVVYKGMDDNSGSTQIISCAKVTVTTILKHAKTSQERSVEFVVYPDKSNMHGVQAAVTYLKRNNIILLLDIAVCDEDDDGNGGVAYDPDDKRNGSAQRQTGTRRPPINNNTGAGKKPEFTTGSGKPVDMQQATSGLKPEDLQPQPGDLPFYDAPPSGIGGSEEPWNDPNKAQGPEQTTAKTVDPARPMTDAERKRLGIVEKKQVDTMTALLKKKGVPPEKMFPYLECEWSYRTISEIRVEDYSKIMDVIENHPEKIMNPGAK
jgi:hypothetical protein